MKFVKMHLNKGGFLLKKYFGMVVVLLEIEIVRERIKLLDESDAKGLLMIIYAGLDTALTGTGGDVAQRNCKKFI
jgi:hypothetical protein